ncbi:ketoacid CoA transferase, partial [Halioglobus sp.]|nr:ketoacid CoA transferase [Halioglobus sp.]
MTAATDYTLAELCIVAASQAFANEGEVLATGIGVIPRLAASLAMKTTNPELMMTDSEAWMLSEPNPLGKRPDSFVPA